MNQRSILLQAVLNSAMQIHIGVNHSDKENRAIPIVIAFNDVNQKVSPKMKEFADKLVAAITPILQQNVGPQGEAFQTLKEIKVHEAKNPPPK